ncbi:MAG: futalosine hydrolase [Phycisphaerales bacterium]
MPILFITAVQREASAIRSILDADDCLIVSGIGRTNAAAATTEAILQHGPFELAVSSGIAGALPGSNLSIGDIIAATACVYAEEGIISPEGFGDVTVLGFPLGNFAGNSVPCSAAHVALLPSDIARGRIATVATCSGTDDAAEIVSARTGAVAEAMEGAAVVHAALRLHVPGLEIRAISNTTGDRDRQTWDIEKALKSLGLNMSSIRRALRK